MIISVHYSFSANKTWLGGTSTAWNNAANWSGGTLPAHGDNITIAKTGSFDPNITTSAIAMTFRAGNLTINAGNTLTLSFPLHATQHLIVEGSWANNGTLNHSGTGVVRMTGAVGGTPTIGGSSVSTFTTMAIVGGAYELANDIIVNNRLNFTGGILDTRAFSLSGTGTMDMSGVSSFTIGTLGVTVPELTGAYSYTNEPNIVFNGAGSQTIRGGRNYPAIEIGNTGVKTLGGDITVLYNILASGTASLDVSVNNYTITISGLSALWSGWQFNEPAAFVARNGTVVFEGDCEIWGDYVPYFHHVTITGILTGGDGVFNADTMYVSGNWTNNGSYSHNGGTVIFNGSGNIGGTAVTTFNDILISGTLTGHATNINIAGIWANNGTFVHNSGMVTFIGTSSAVSGSSITSFYHLSIGNMTPGLSLTGHPVNMNIAGNWASNATYTHNNGTVTFTGSALQILSGSVSSPFYNIEVDNTSTGIALAQNISVSNNITMTDGDLDIRDYDINMGTGTTGSILGETEAKRIMATDGVGGDGLGTGTVYTTRDIGSPSALNVAGLGAMITSAVNMGSTTITRSHQVNNGSGSFTANESVYRSYTITPSTNSGLNATLRFYYWDAELNGHAEAELELYRYINSGSYWQPEGATTNDAGNNYVELTGIDGFSKWTLGSTSIPLPIELINFDAQYVDELVYLSWITASEVNNDYFTIERMNEANTILEIISIEGAGNSQVKQCYQAIDENPLPGISYYRLKQTDYDGHFTYSNWVMVNSITTGKTFDFNVFPNPSDGKELYINVYFADDHQKKLSVTIHTFDGQLLYSKNQIMDETHTGFKIIPENFLSPGVYTLSVILEDKAYCKKIFVE